MPIILGLTLRAAKRKKPPPVIPNKPMFHDDPYLRTSSPGPSDEGQPQLQEQQPEGGPQLEPHQGAQQDPRVPMDPQAEQNDEQETEASNQIASPCNVKIIYVKPYQGECSHHM